ncbi:ATP-binding protein [Subtercola endophyticus]|uniref:ATP-binding protein n=1 Tax=Subtercola endophyticus TaxID=2895559 RepID=UPI001E39BE9A|nr:SbcC/MukB-like Walker B domain-containing protein [Subtercola endophyticus]UFS57577.1 hypothetical protein LQ955_10940 [Subtercola endophyticus]
MTITTDAPQATEPTPLIHPGQWRLARVELFNWGTFDGHYRIDVARQGHLFTGASGSGKSSLLDAIAVVITPGRLLRFNAAAQDSASRNDDRTTVSYVRGAWSKESDTEHERAVSSFLRNGARWSGVLLRFDDGRGEIVTLVRLFSIRAGSADKADLKDLAFVGRHDVDLPDFAPFVSGGLEAKRVKSRWPEAVVTTNGSHKAYFVRLTKLLGISGENALYLLHKTQSAKNLGSLDQLFRGFMLDTPQTFDRERSAREQFTDLNQAHRLVVDARKQAAELAELEPIIDAYESGVEGEARAEHLSQLVQPFQDRFTLKFVNDDYSDTVARSARAEADAAATASAAREAFDQWQVAQRAASELGGADADRAQERVTEAREAAARTESAYNRLVAELQSVQLNPPTSASEFAELRETTRRQNSEAAPAAALHKHDDQKSYFEAKRDLDRITGELNELQTRRSNLPAGLLVVRRQLTKDLGLTETALPFVGELIDVRPEYAVWAGAIERVLRPFATTLVIRDDLLRDVRRWVESRNIGTRLTFESVPTLAETPRRPRSARSLLHRIRVSDSPFHDWLTTRLWHEFDFDCVDSPDRLDEVERGVTVAGQVKKSARRYEKNDRDSIDDRTKWILGGNNDAKVDALLERRRSVESQLFIFDARLKEAQATRDQLTKRRTVLESVSNREWDEVDRRAAAVLLKSRTDALAALTVTNPALEDAVAREAATHAEWDAAQVAERAAAIEVGRLSNLLLELKTERTRLSDRLVGTELSETDSAALEARFRSFQRKFDRVSIAEVGTKVSTSLVREVKACADSAAAARSRFESLVHDFRNNWQAASGDLTSSIGDRAGYRALREQIETRGLPSHEQNFLRLLRERSRDSIAYLLSDIRDAPKLVKERIDPVNDSLRRSLFDRDRYLRIRVREQRTPEVVNFISDLKKIVEGNWSDGDLAGAEERFAVLEGLMARLGSSDYADARWKQACLDTREHVTFQAEEIDAAERVTNVHDSSAGLSGGQRQKLVIFCLAAALRYQLAPDEVSIPRFGTVILDEAFDKADSTYTRMAMDVFVEFGFHMILATPQKLLTTIEPYVGAVTSISNETRRKSTIANVVFGTGEPQA